MLLSTKCASASALLGSFDATRLYDQSAVLYSFPKSQELIGRARLGQTSPEITSLQDSLVMHFQANLATQLHAVRIKQLIPFALKSAFLIPTIGIAYYLLGSNHWFVKILFERFSFMEYEILATVEEYVKGTIFERFISPWLSFFLQESTQIFDYTRLEEEYIRNKPFIDSGLYGSIEQALIKERNNFHFSKEKQYPALFSGWSYPISSETGTTELVETALKLPRTRKLVERTPEQIQHFIEQNFSIYANYEHFSRRIQEIIEIFLINQTRHKHAKLQVFLHGPPGVGKTRMIGLLAQFLGLPMARMELGSASSSFLSVYTSTGGGKQLSEMATTLANPLCPVTGKITRAYTNQIVVFDEGDRYVSTEVKPRVLQLLDPESPPLVEHSLGITLDLQNYLYIASGNGSIDSVIDGKPLQVPPDSTLAPSPPRPVDNALSDRFLMLLFPGFNPQKFPELIKECLQNHVETFILPPLAIDETFLAMSIEDDNGNPVKISDYIASIASHMKSSTSYRTIEHRCMLIYIRAILSHRRSAK